MSFKNQSNKIEIYTERPARERQKEKIGGKEKVPSHGCLNGTDVKFRIEKKTKKKAREREGGEKTVEWKFPIGENIKTLSFRSLVF